MAKFIGYVCLSAEYIETHWIISFNINMRLVNNDLNEQQVKLLGAALLNSIPGRRLC